MMGVIDDLSALPDSGFGCAVANRFGLLDDEADPFDILRAAQAEKQQQQQQKKKKKEEQKKVDPGKPGKKETQKERKAPISAGGDAGQKAPVRVGRAPSEDLGEKRVEFRERRYNEMNAPLEYSIVKPQDQADPGARGGRGGARGRGGRGGAYPRGAEATDQRRKREFDRHSGSVKTGVRPEEKRGGNGSHNWGSMKDQMSAVMDEITNEGLGDAEGVQEAAKVDGELRVTDPDKEGAGKEAAQMSLDEWKALQQQSRPKMELNLRRADTSGFSKAVVIHQSKHLEDVSDGPEEEEDGPVFRRPANDITSRMKINFGCLERPMRGGRGGRGGGGGPGRGSPFPAPEAEPQLPAVVAPPMPPAAAPNPNDHEDFPELGARKA